MAKWLKDALGEWQLAATLRLLAGEHFAGRFRVERLLGEGAMAHVYAVEVLDGGRQCALKVLRADVIEHDPKALDRFSREVSVGERIGSKHVVEVLDSGVHGENPWILMELLEGLSLEAFVTERQPKSVERWAVLAQLFEAMARAHGAGVIHRDLKPDNILVIERGGAFVKLLDFGVTKTTTEKQLHASLTDSGLGTPLWAAPEQGGTVHLSPACDVWALGLLAFYTLTSKIYWRHMNIASSAAIDIAIEVLRAPIEAASTRATWLGCANALPPNFDHWFRHCVHRRPEERFETARAAYNALQTLRP